MTSPESPGDSDRAAEARDVWNDVFEQARDRGLEWEANAFLAERGWDVAGFDISDEAVRQARATAEGAGLELEAEIGDVNDYDYGNERWDLVVVMYMHGLILPRVDDIVDSLAPGGILVVEGFHRDLGVESVQGGYFGYRTNELLRAFDGLRVLYYEDRMDDADWGRNLPGDKPIVRLVARKQAANERL